MATIGNLYVELRINSIKFQQGLEQANKRLSRFTSFANKAKFAVAGIFAGAGLTIGVREIFQITDKYKLLEGQLRIVTDSTEELADVQGKLFDITQRSRTSYDATIELYARLARSSEDFGATQEQLLATTELINKAIIASGASSTEASAALVQLSQGFASGALRGDELRSVMEQTPRLARAMADGLGVSIGELRKLGEQGELTSERIMGALLSQRETIEEEFTKMPLTIGQAITEVGNEFDRLVVQLDDSSGASMELAEAFQDFASILSDPRTIENLRAVVNLLAQGAVVAAEFGAELLEVINNIRSTFTDASDPMDFLMGQIRDLNTELRVMSMFESGGDDFNARFDERVKRIVEYADNYQKLFENARKANQETQGAVSLGTAPVLTITGGDDRLLELSRLRQINLAKDALRIINETRTPLEKLSDDYMRLNEVWQAGLISTDQYGIAIKNLHDEFSGVNQIATDLGFTFSSAFEDAIVEGGKLRDILKGLEQDIIRIITRQLVTQPIAQGITGFITNNAPSFFGGARAIGGPVSANQSYLVGERGPELFTPRQSGNITPNDKMGGITINNHFVVSTPTGTISRESQSQIAAAAYQGTSRAAEK